MTTLSVPVRQPAIDRSARVPRAQHLRTVATLAGRRLSLSAHTPREIVVPLMTPILFALVIAPALAQMIPSAGGLDYKTFVAVGTVGLLVPLSCMFAGIGVIVDREQGARRELLAAPIPRQLLVVANLLVALLISALQLAALMVAALVRGADFHTRVTGVGWFVGAAVLFGIFSYGIAEVLANRIPKQEEYVGATPAVAIVPWFLAGSLFPIHALPTGLTVVAKVLPLTHAMALMRYGLLDTRATGLHDIWGLHSPTTMAMLSFLVVLVWAAALTAATLRAFSRAAVT
jgi:ABC-type multidrug transport system permease subunit